MALNYTNGTICHLSEITSGTSANGNTWTRMSVILEVPGWNGTSTKIVFNVSGDRVADVKHYKVGDKVCIGWSITAREWNGKWYNNVDLVRISLEETKASSPSPAPGNAPIDLGVDDLPFE